MKKERKTLMAGLVALCVVCAVVVSDLCRADGLIERTLRLIRSQAGIPTQLEMAQDTKWGADSPASDGSWETDKYYMLSAELPERLQGEDLDILIEYPELAASFSTDEITVTVRTNDGELYEGKYQIPASKEMRLVYGSANPQVAMGGEFNRHGDTLEMFFYTIPADQHTRYNEYLDSRYSEAPDGYNYVNEFTYTGAEGVTKVTFSRL